MFFQSRLMFENLIAAFLNVFFDMRFRMCVNVPQLHNRDLSKIEKKTKYI